DEGEQTQQQAAHVAGVADPQQDGGGREQQDRREPAQRASHRPSQTCRRTAVTLPRIVAWSPSMGSKAGLWGSSQVCPPVCLKVFTVASSSSSAATMSPLSAVGCWRTTTQSPSQMAASIIESPTTLSR